MLRAQRREDVTRVRSARRDTDPCSPPPLRRGVFFFQAEDGIRDLTVTGVQTCALPIWVGFDTNSTAAAIVPPAGKITGTGPALSLDPAQNNTFAALNRAWKLGARVSLSAARYLVVGLPAAQQDDLVKSLALQAERTAAPAGAREIARPRVGLYRPFMASMDEGWTRWMLERYGFDI